MNDLLLVSALALIDSQNRVLLAQRPEGKEMAGLWEFPGGKIHKGETPEEALVREIKEELDITINATDLEPLSFASHSYTNFHLLMPLFLCHKWDGEIKPLEGQAFEWVHLKDINKYEMPPADVPLVKALTKA